ncbi:hypothetical protein A1O7_08826 [Cladophialophora yegresii CBS 114405]|uniref:Ribosome biogenesis protein Alb1 n=1 Tax=Cladophialophora yegresii CBS 114405 TaxID=1182544 RepID=W9VSD2_9EURO|nr:uncharacterized protein A1O7_08826 [Cladophialophora yegresii CBS 114405]EXJ55895.1 hypothetical protein A1O7_08826 [Cladophialophora yegresii CBS 114405]
MAKTAKVKKATANSRSRASKRATSPSIDVDKSIKQAPRASDVTPLLAARPNGGVTKSKKKQKPLTRGQRQRQERVLARAEVVQDQMSKKVEDAAGRLKKRRERKCMWDEVNGSVNKFEKLKTLGDEVDEEEKDEWEDMEEVDERADNLPGTADTHLVVVDRTAHSLAAAPTAAEDDEVDKIT